VAVVLFAVGSLIIGERPAFDAPAGEVAQFFDEARTRIHVALALFAAAAPLLVWFLVTVASLRTTPSERSRAHVERSSWRCCWSTSRRWRWRRCDPRSLA